MSAPAEEAALRHALARGFLDPATLARAREESARSGRPLLPWLRERYLTPAQVDELAAIYRQHAKSSGFQRTAPVDLPTVPRTPGISSNSSADGLPQPGQTLGRYQLQRLLGKGGMGAVYLARDPTLGRDLAIKVVLPELAGAVDMLERFQREAQALAALDHPGIVRVHEAGAAGQPPLPYLVLDFVPGESLQARLNRDGPLPLRDAAELVRQLAQALQHAHERGVLHRDLKPENVLVGPDGKPRVTDFGLARLLDREALTRTGEVLGTPAYMAPEQASGETGHFGPHTDVYGLGAILYALLTGRAPFGTGPQMQLLAAVLMKAPDPPRAHRGELASDLARALEVICQHCLEKEPDDRYASAGELGDDLERWLAGEPIHAQRPSAGLRARRWARRHRPQLIGAILVVVLIAVGVGWTIKLMLAAEPPATHDVTPGVVALARKALSEDRPEEAIQLLQTLEEPTDATEELLLECYERHAELLARASEARPVGEDGGWGEVVAARTKALEAEPTALRYEARACAYDRLTAERALRNLGRPVPKAMEQRYADLKAKAR